jgi:hypothetical protein
MRTQSQQKQSRSMVQPLFIAIVLAAVACGVGYVALRQMKETAQRQAEQKAKTDYQQKLAATADEILAATTKCVDMCGVYSEEWRDGIEHDNMSLWLLHQIDKFEENGNNAAIASSKKRIDQLMSDLASPPASMTDVHRTLVELYGIYSQIHGCASGPSGSLMSYNNTVNDLQSKYVKVANELKVTLPK